MAPPNTDDPKPRHGHVFVVGAAIATAWTFAPVVCQVDDITAAFRRRALTEIGQRIPYNGFIENHIEKACKVLHPLELPRSLSVEEMIAESGRLNAAVREVAGDPPTPRYFPFEDWIAECVAAGINVAPQAVVLSPAAA